MFTAGVLFTVVTGTFAVTLVAEVLTAEAFPVAVLPVERLLPGLVVTALLVIASVLLPTLDLTPDPPLSELLPAITLLEPV